MAALMTFTSHIAGKNATVEIHEDRIEWTTPGKLTMVGRKPETEMIPVRSITSVSTKRDGIRYHAVSLITSGNTIDMRVTKDEADRIKATVTQLILA